MGIINSYLFVNQSLKYVWFHLSAKVIQDETVHNVKMKKHVFYLDIFGKGCNICGRDC